MRQFSVIQLMSGLEVDEPICVPSSIGSTVKSLVGRWVIKTRRYCPASFLETAYPLTAIEICHTDQFIHQRIHGSLGYQTSIEYRQAFGKLLLSVVISSNFYVMLPFYYHSFLQNLLLIHHQITYSNLFQVMQKFYRL